MYSSNKWLWNSGPAGPGQPMENEKAVLVWAAVVVFALILHSTVHLVLFWFLLCLLWSQLSVPSLQAWLPLRWVQHECGLCVIIVILTGGTARLIKRRQIKASGFSPLIPPPIQ